MLCQHMGNAFHNVGNRVFMGDTPHPGNGTTAPRSAVLSENAHYSGAQSIARAFQILRCVAKAGGEGLRLREVAAQVPLNSSTPHQLLRRSDERRVGKECVSTCSYPVSPSY